MSVMRHRARIAAIGIAILVAAGCGNSQASSGGAASTPGQPGAITGHVYNFRSSAEAQRMPMPHARVAAYTQRVRLVGPVMADPPLPVKTTMTDTAGSFTLSGLKPGRYFVTSGTAGTWVRLSTGGATPITLSICRDCPVPLAAGS
jgi:hypothetical protein